MGFVCAGVLTGATKAKNAKIAGKFDGHLRLSEGLNVTSSGEAKGVRNCDPTVPQKKDIPGMICLVYPCMCSSHVISCFFDASTSSSTGDRIDASS